MAKSLKIFLIILGLGIFILPKQTVFAQKVENCCEQKSKKDECCNTEKTKPCHESNPKKGSEKDGCKNDCANCHSCSGNIALNYISPESYTSQKQLFIKKISFSYEISFFSSSIQNIWQPPKLC